MATAASRSAEGSTTNGSLPPSSSTDFFRWRPAVPATDRPARSLPVRVTATTRSSAITPATASDSISSVWNTPSGAPARRNTSSSASAQRGTLAACFNRPTLPAPRAGAAKRITCQNGKFQGMTARIGPSGWNSTRSSMPPGSCRNSSAR